MYIYIYIDIDIDMYIYIYICKPVFKTVATLKISIKYISKRGLYDKKTKNAFNTYIYILYNIFLSRK